MYLQHVSKHVTKNNAGWKCTTSSSEALLGICGHSRPAFPTLLLLQLHNMYCYVSFSDNVWFFVLAIISMSQSRNLLNIISIAKKYNTYVTHVLKCAACMIQIHDCLFLKCHANENKSSNTYIYFLY